MESQKLIDLINDSGYTARSYSGRGMYGKVCVGVSVDDSYGFIADLMLTVAGYEDNDLLEDTIRLVSWTRDDSLGRGLILYWPRMTWPEDLTDDSDYDEDNE